MRDHRVALETLESHYSGKGCRPDMFFDFVHPEAALMALLNYCNGYSAQAGQEVEFGDPQTMQQIVQRVRSFHPSCIVKLTLREGGGSWGGRDCC